MRGGKGPILRALGLSNIEGHERRWRLKDKVPLRTKYHLWYDYLKESPKFIQACRDALLLEKKIGKKGAPWFYGSGIFAPVPSAKAKREPTLEETRGIERMELGYGVSVFGNILVLKTFSQWWKVSEKLRAKYDRIFKSTPLIEDYSIGAGRDIRRVIDEFKENWGRDPNLNEFSGHYRSLLQSPNSVCLYLKINLQNRQPVEAYEKALRNLISEKKSDPRLGGYVHFGWRWLYPTTSGKQFYAKKLQRYLNVFRAFKKGLSAQQIAKLGPRYREAGVKEEESDRVTVLADRRIARQIIANCESGIFPGIYRK